MSKAASYNKYLFELPEGFKFKTLAEKFTEVGEELVPVRGLYMNRKSQYGDHPVCITDKELLDLPKHLADSVEDMLGDRDLVDEVLAGNVFLRIRPYSRNGQKFYSVEWM